MVIDRWIEYVGYEGSFFEFLNLLDNKLKKENRTIKLWCDLEFLPKVKKTKRIIPVYYRKYPCAFVSIKDSIKNGDLLEAFREIIRRIKYRNYLKYFKCKKEDKIPCCLVNCNGNLEVVEGVKEEDFKGIDNTLILRCYSIESGIFSNLLYTLPYFKWAAMNNLNIYFDMSIGDSPYREVEGENAWEYYYEQIGNKPCDNDGTIISYLFELSEEYKIPFETKYIAKMIDIHSIYDKYVKLNARMLSIINRNWKKISGGVVKY